MKLQGDILREMQLTHYGKLMASLSHDFKNHLAIINESGGLMEDLLLLATPEKPANSERFRKIIGTINERIIQASEMCRFLSSFAHRTDQPLSTFSVTEVIREELYLLRRFAHQKQTDIHFSGAQDLPSIYNNASLLQFALFCIIWPPLDHLYQSTISVTLSGLTAAVDIGVQISNKTPETSNNSWREILPAALEALGAELARQTVLDGREEFGVILSSVEKPSP